MAFELAGELEKQMILSSDQAATLRAYIHTKNPLLSKSGLASIFAGAVHLILDKELHEFDLEPRGHIKDHLLSFVVTRRTFFMCAHDVFASIIQTSIDSVKGMQSLISWLTGRFSESQESEVLSALEGHLIRPKATNESSDSPIPSFVAPKRRFIPLFNLKTAIGTALVLMFFMMMLYRFTPGSDANFSDDLDFRLEPTEIVAASPENPVNVYKSTFNDITYQAINSHKLAAWLSKRGSLLADLDHLTPILVAAEDQDINPLVMIAVVGQEQSFVPATSSRAHEIINNPFNVFGSWVKYNTSITDSAEIAARTIHRYSLDCPPDMDILEWINRGYAEDTNWWKGVRSILTDLEHAELNE
ncbi:MULTISPECIES: hypothetical protein [unclassified Fusibacter]|uniref:hypothetical protein n=1 Tax=unclassified Fusibacter TaxID=2624464 RepID=UPI0010129A3B|nr:MULTISPECIES: hypothetical protein [unclassified Fusibacter]MCK8058342.1 hypothetical protein [Fusibacter sp. A2]NPE20925.1 hypothetical protein [Fusibacter sp. A1]RXV63128.1 hypothetical protein DWB64_03750 [Fusibacter sp. A1]